MTKYVFRWELPDGNGPTLSRRPTINEKGDYRYVFTTIKSALMWLQDLGWNYDNPTHSDLVLCIYEADECYPVCVDIGTREKPHRSACNSISSFCEEYIARVWNRLPISYMEYEDIKAFGKALSRCKSQKALVEFLQLSSKDELRADSVSFYSRVPTTKWVYWQNDGQSHELVTDTDIINNR